MAGLLQPHWPPSTPKSMLRRHPSGSTNAITQLKTSTLTLGVRGRRVDLPAQVAARYVFKWQCMFLHPAAKSKFFFSGGLFAFEAESTVTGPGWIEFVLHGRGLMVRWVVAVASSASLQLCRPRRAF